MCNLWTMCHTNLGKFGGLFVRYSWFKGHLRHLLRWSCLFWFLKQPKSLFKHWKFFIPCHLHFHLLCEFLGLCRAASLWCYVFLHEVWWPLKLWRGSWLSVWHLCCWSLHRSDGFLHGCLDSKLCLALGFASRIFGSDWEFASIFIEHFWYVERVDISLLYNLKVSGTGQFGSILVPCDLGRGLSWYPDGEADRVALTNILALKFLSKWWWHNRGCSRRINLIKILILISLESKLTIISSNQSQNQFLVPSYKFETL